MAEEIGGVDVSDFGLSAEDLANLKRNQALYSAFGLGSKEDRAAQLEEQKSMTKANILFDLAQAGLIIASTPPTKGESPAATLARAAASSEFFPKVGARSAELQKTKTAMDAQERQMNMAAVQRMQTQRDARISAEAAAAKEAADRAHDERMLALGLTADLTKMETKGVIDRNNNLTLQEDLFDRKTNLEKVLQGNRESLAELKGDLTVDQIKLKSELEAENLQVQADIDKIKEDQKQENRIALEKTKDELKQGLIALRAEVGLKSDTQLQNQEFELKEKLARINSDLKMSELGVSNTYDLEKMDKAHEYATELNSTNNALKKELALLDNEVAKRNATVNENKQALAENQAKINNAVGERKIELEEERNALEAERVRLLEEKQTADELYNKEKLELEKAASALTKFGTSTEARITTFLADKNRIDQYGSGLSKEEGGMSEQEIIEMNQVISYYNRAKSVWNDSTKRYEIVDGNPLSNELVEAITTRKLNGMSVPNIKSTREQAEEILNSEGGKKIKEIVTSKIMENVDYPMGAFGSGTVLATGINTMVELLSFGALRAPFGDIKDAVAASKALNTKFLQTFQDSAQLRDSVAQLNLLKGLAPNPNWIFEGDDAAISKITSMLGLIDEARSTVEAKLYDKRFPLSPKETTDAKKYLDGFNQLEAGYKVFINAYNAQFELVDLDEGRDQLFNK